MNLKELYDYLMENNGFTIDFNLEIPNDLKYIVSIPNCEIIIPLKELTFEVFKANLSKTVKNFILTDYNNKYIGCWINSDKVYFDISISCNNIKDALIIGKENNQLAIYDFINQKSIYIEG